MIRGPMRPPGPLARDPARHARGAPRPFPWSWVLLAILAGSTAPAHARTPADPSSSGTRLELTGEWTLNVRASQHSPLPERKASPADGPDGALLHDIPPEDSVLPDPVLRNDPAGERPRAVRRRPPSWLFRPERLEALRQLLGEGQALSIVQAGRYVDLRFPSGTRTLELGAESQVSLPTGELADQRVRWSSGRLLVERKVPRGAKLVETYRLLPATGQLEVTVRRSSGDGFPKIEWRRVFDREPVAAAIGDAPNSAP